MRNAHTTWLEFVNARYHGGTAATRPALVRLHGHSDPFDGSCAGIVISIDDRTLVSSGGRVTVFCCLEAAERFLAIAGMEDYEFIDVAADNGPYPDQAHCLSLSRRGLRECRACHGTVSRVATA